MQKNSFRVSSVLAGLAAAAAIAATPSAAAAGLDPIPAPPSAGAPPTQASPVPDQTPSRGTVALPPGAPVDIFPQDQTVGGADPFVPFGTDPYVPYGVWNP
jgi:uncharacterized lipoprotein YbaY